MISILSDLPQEVLDAVESAFAINNESGKILACNRAFKNFSGAGEKNLVGLTIYDCLPQNEAELFIRTDIELLANKKDYLSYQFVRKLKGGADLMCSTHKSLAIAIDGSASIIVVINSAINKGGKRHFKQSLTPREISILELLVFGNTQKKIALVLGISPHTVADYMKSIYIKLDVNTRTEAQLKAIMELGLGGN